jgi:acyl-CoA thioester hydrolase
MSISHRHELRVYYEDTDFSSFVYHASYLRFMERGRTEFLRELGITQSILQETENGLVFVVARLTIDFLRPARMDDLLTIETTAIEARGPIIKLKQCVLRAAECLAEAVVTVVAVRDGRPVRLPGELRAKFTDLETAGT